MQIAEINQTSLQINKTVETNNPAAAFVISDKKSFSRKQSPTQLQPATNDNIPQRSKSRRIQETLLAASEIHGATKENRKPALDGMFSTLETYGGTEVFEQYFSKSKKLEHASATVIKKSVNIFEKSSKNVCRSLSLLYGAGLLSKRKYAHIRSALGTASIGATTAKGYLKRSRIKIEGIPIPEIIPYKELISKINEINIGNLFSVRDTLCGDLPDELKVDGVYRNLEELLLSVAQFYLEVDSYRGEDDRLCWLGGEVGEFKVAIGGDGAPFGKWDESMSWLVSFLNAGPRVASPNDNFLLFGANCKETHEAVIRFAKLLNEQCLAIESKTYTLCEKTVKFTFELVPSDMKFLAFINGELSNSATYFSSFANVSTNDLSSLEGQFGTDLDCRWKRWSYNFRIKVAHKVTQFKAKLSKNLSTPTKRKKVTQFIASEKARQEFEPFIGPLCEKAVLEPLHLKNNAVQKLHNEMLKLALANSNLPGNISSVA